MIHTCQVNDCRARWLRLPFRLGYLRLSLRAPGCHGRYEKAHRFEVFRNNVALGERRPLPYPKAGLWLTRRGVS